MSIVDKTIKMCAAVKEHPEDRSLVRYAQKLLAKIIRKYYNNTAPTKCKKCGDCCRGFVVGITTEDLQREPKLQKFIVPSTVEDHEKGTTLAVETWKIPIGTTYSECPFLKQDESKFYCSIHETKPVACKKFVTSNFSCHCAMLSGRGVRFPHTIQELLTNGWPMPMVVCKLMEATGDREHDTQIGIEYKWLHSI